MTAAALAATVTASSTGAGRQGVPDYSDLNPAAATTQYKTWRTHQMSDHLPLWAEFKTNFTDQYLGSISGRVPA